MGWEREREGIAERRGGGVIARWWWWVHGGSPTRSRHQTCSPSKTESLGSGRLQEQQRGVEDGYWGKGRRKGKAERRRGGGGWRGRPEAVTRAARLLNLRL